MYADVEGAKGFKVFDDHYRLISGCYFGSEKNFALKAEI